MDNISHVGMERYPQLQSQTVVDQQSLCSVPRDAGQNFASTLEQKQQFTNQIHTMHQTSYPVLPSQVPTMHHPSPRVAATSSIAFSAQPSPAVSREQAPASLISWDGVKEWVSLERDVFLTWCSIGNSLAFSSDSQIAAFLMNCYQNKVDSKSFSLNETCGLCGTNLILMCPSCSSQQQQQILQQKRISVKQQQEQQQLECKLPDGDSHQRQKQQHLQQLRTRKVSNRTKSRSPVPSRSDQSSSDTNHDLDPASKNITVKLEPEADPVSIKPEPNLYDCDSDTVDNSDLVGLKKMTVLKPSDKDLLKCRDCSKTFSSTGHLKRHKRLNRCKALVKKFGHTCSECKKPFKTALGMDRHMKDCHKERLHVCEVCSRALTSSAKLTSHMDRVHSISPQCQQCGKKFGLKSSLKKHMSEVHGENRNIVCTLCNKVFTSKAGLKQHMNIHQGHKPWMCDICGVSFTQVGNLSKHKLIHTGEKAFQCDMCEKAFSRSFHLRRHKLSHTGQKSHMCDVCSMAFTHLHNLKRHKMTHSGVKAFICDVCNKAFTFLQNLNDHKVLHTGVKNHVCDICDKAFALGYEMRRHKKMVHKVGVNPKDNPQDYSCMMVQKGLTSEAVSNSSSSAVFGTGPKLTEDPLVIQNLLYQQHPSHFGPQDLSVQKASKFS